MGRARALILVALLSGFGVAAMASAPDRSERPKKRPWEITYSGISALAPEVSIRPRSRDNRANEHPTRAPGIGDLIRSAVIEQQIRAEQAAADRAAREAARQSARAQNRIANASALAVAQSDRPRGRPRGLRIVAVNPPSKPVTVTASRSGAVCGLRGVRGQSVARVTGKISGCGIANPVQITHVDGIELTRPAVLNCDTVRALNTWVTKSLKPTMRRSGGGAAKLQMVSAYSCRTRNSKRGKRLSEHATGNAIDIAGVITQDGTIYSVKRDWNRGTKGRKLQTLHKQACGIFGTVLGPWANKAHEDHFHFDVAKYRSGPYCE